MAVVWLTLVDPLVSCGTKLWSVDIPAKANSRLGSWACLTSDLLRLASAADSTRAKAHHALSLSATIIYYYSKAKALYYAILIE